MLSEKNKILIAGIGIAVLAAAAPLSTKLTSIVSILLVLAWLLEGNWKFKWQAIKQNYLLLFFICFYLLHILGLLYTQNVSSGLFDLEKKLSLILLPLIIGSSMLLREDKHLRERLHTWFVGSCFAALLFCLGHGFYRYMAEIPPVSSVYGGFEATQQFRTTHSGASGIWEYITYTELLLPLGTHPTYMSVYLLLCISILIESVTFNAQPLKRQHLYIQLTLIVFFTVSIFLLASRVAVLLYLLVVGFYLFKYARRKLSWKFIAATGVAFALALTVLVNYVPVVKHRFVNDFTMLGQAYSSDNPGTGMSMRIAFWKTALDVVQKYPLAGVGTGDLEEAMSVEYINNGLDDLQGYNPHNQYLQTGIMVGVAGVALLLLLLLYPLVVARRRGDSIYITFILIVSVSFLTESVLQSNKGILFFALFNSVYFITYKQKHIKRASYTGI